MIHKLNENILITGGHGFLGSALTQILKSSLLPDNICNPSSKKLDLLNCTVNKIASYLKHTNINIIVHLAAAVGGIGANKAKPGEFFYKNMQMGMNLLEAARRVKSVRKVINIGTVCSYPKNPPVPFVEDDIWNGYPEGTNAPYGIAKKALMEMGQAYNKQYGMNNIFVIPTNMYGPGDNFDPASSHVIPAIIYKIAKAKHNNVDTVELWGSGNATRDFLFVSDAANAIYKTITLYDKPQPINIGSGVDYSIKYIAGVIAKKMNWNGKFVWDTSKPDGQPKRVLDTTRAQKELGFVAKTPIALGIKETVKYFERQFII